MAAAGCFHLAGSLPCLAARQLVCNYLSAGSQLPTLPTCPATAPSPWQFIDAHGLEEAGVDGGGIFKEFVEAVRDFGWWWMVVVIGGGGVGLAAVV